MRQYLVVRADKSLIGIYHDFEAIRNWTIEILRQLTDPEAPEDLIDMIREIEVVATPSLGFRWMIEGAPEREVEPEPEVSELVISYAFPDAEKEKQEEKIRRLRDFLWRHLGDFQEKDPRIIVPPDAILLRNIGADPMAHICSSHPCAPARVFGNRRRVREMMGIDALRDLTGRGVNVVIIDQGLNAEEIKARNPQNWGGGLATTTAVRGSEGRAEATTTPGSAPVTSHGMMIARNILDIAPEAKLYDVPLIPPHIARANVFASTAHAVFKAVIEKIIRLRESTGADSAWVLVNAWAIFDRSGEYPPGDYTLDNRVELIKEAPGKLSWEVGHPLNRMVRIAVDNGIDVVFGAGNCGQFTAETRCGKHDRGEGNSIWGANAHEAVLTVGAVSANEQWLGYSSQGPAPWGYDSRQKPDVCTPSHFCEDYDASRINSGTSAATGLAAGVLAAIRQKFGPDKLSSRQLKAAINASARGQGGIWNARTGHGVLDAGALLTQLGTPAPAQAQA